MQGYPGFPRFPRFPRFLKIFHYSSRKANSMSIFTRAFVIVALSLIQQYVYATTYYVDSQLGNDSWSGKLRAPASSDGPWQSLNRLAGTQLAPGDIVELQCGSKW